MKNLICVLAIIAITAVASAQTSPSAIFYSDLTSGPNTGGQNNAGAFITIHGKGFGSSQGSSYVTVGSGKAASYQMWSDTAITFQLGSAAKTGNIVVNVAGVTSNSVPFTVRTGNIYFVSTSGNDAKAGSYAAPWKTVTKAASTMKAGDTVYLENGYTLSGSGSGAALTLKTSGTASTPLAIVAYPNSAASIGSTKITTGVNVTGSNWVLAGLTLAGSQTAVSASSVTGIRIAGSNISCPSGYGTGGCVSTTNGSSVALLGNQIHDTGSTSSTNLANYHSVRLLGTNTIEAGWNQVLNTRGCNAISVEPNGSAQYGITVHDNFIQNTRCEAISLSNVNPAQSAVNIYNNIIVSSGTGPAPGGTSSSNGYAAIRVGGSSSTAAQVYNNTVYDAGSFGGTSAGVIRNQTAVTFTNNIFYIATNELYVSADSSLGLVNGPNNLFYGNGTPPGMFTNSLASDPLFVSPSNGNFHLQSGSPAIDAGTTVQLASDFDGMLRPQGNAIDLGAYEATSSASAGTVTGTLSASPATLSFGTVTTGQSTTSSTVITNTGTGSVTLSQANSTSSAFQASGITFPLTLAAGQSATLTVTFAPTTSGSQSGTIAIASNATNSIMNVSVSGTGQAASPTVSLSPSTLTFASQTVGTTSTAQNVVVSNKGTASLSITSIALTGGDFAMTNGCGSSLAAGASCSIAVTFKPTATGTRTGTITLTDNASSGTQQIALTGTGAGVPTVSLSPASTLTFASQTMGTTSAAQNITVSNTGAASLSITSVALTGGDFAMTNGCGSSLAAGASCSIAVTFKPTATGTRTGTITLTDNASSGTQQIALTGTGAGVPTVSLSPASLTFASQTVATTSATQNVTVSNTGTASLSVSSVALTGSDFAMTNGCGSSLAAGASCSIAVTFKPTAAGTRTGTITLTDNASSGTQQVALSGTGVAATGTLSAASPLSFGTVSVGSTGSQSVTITNTGSASVTISAINTGNTAFAVSGVTLPVTVAAGSSVSLNVAFAPTAASTYTSTLTITSNASNPTLSVSLSGTGATATIAHQVTVAWTDSASVSGFNVYRSTTSGSGYTKMNTSLIANTSYVDTSVIGGSTYYYVVTAVDSTGVESAYSAEASAAVPTP